MKKRLLIKIIFLLFLGGIIFQKSNPNFIRQWIVKNDPVHSDLLIVEGFFFKHKEVVNEYYRGDYKDVLVTGTYKKDEASLQPDEVFCLKNIPDSVKLISYSMKGSFFNGENAKIHVSINGTLVTSNKCKKDSSVSISWDQQKIDSIVFRFNDDSARYKYLSKLIINKIQINGQSITLCCEDNYTITNKHKIVPNYNSTSGYVANELINLGIPKEKIHFVITTNEGLSKTYNQANNAINWMKMNNRNSANILSISYHSKRTFLCFKKANDKKLNIGIIAVETPVKRPTIIKEVTGILFVSLIPGFILNAFGSV